MTAIDWDQTNWDTDETERWISNDPILFLTCYDKSAEDIRDIMSNFDAEYFDADLNNVEWDVLETFFEAD